MSIREDDEGSGRAGVQSVEVGLALFRRLADAGRPLALSDLARAAGMHRAKAHRYLASLMQAGFVKQLDDGSYDIGPYVLDLSIACMARLDPVQLGAAAAAGLAAACDETCVAAVWTGAGATVVRACRPQRQVAIGIAEGTVFNLTMSATGRVFAAWLPAAETQAALDAELAGHKARRNRLAPRSAKEMQAVLEEVRREGLSAVRGLNAPGVNALAAPVFDAGGRIVLALTLVGPEMSLDVAYDGRPARLLRRAAAGLSARLGWRAA